MNKLTAKHILVIISMMGMIGIVLGLCTNVTGVFFTPIAEEFGVGKGSVSMTLTISSLIMAFSGMISARLIKPSNFRRMILLWSMIIAGSTALLAFTTNITQMYILQAIRGFAAGLIGMVMVTPVINAWFYKNVGFFTSLCLGFSGLTGAIFSPVMTSVMQKYGWRTGYLAIAALVVLYALPAILSPIGMRPEDAGTLPYGQRTETAGTSSQSKQSRIPLLLFAAASLYSITASYGTAMPQHFPGIAESFSLSAGIGALMVSTAMVVNTGGKVLLGILIDAFGSRRSNSAFLLLVAAGAASMLLVHNTAGMFLGAAFIGLAYSLGSVGIVMAVRDIFGDENYSRVYPRIALFTTLANSVATSLIGVLYDASGSYTSGLLSVGLIPILGFFLLQICYQRKAS